MRTILDSLTARLLRRRTALDVLGLHNEMVTFLLELLRAAHVPPRGGAGSARPLTGVLAHVETHVGEALPVAELAAKAGLSVPRVKARFTAELGVPPGEYVLRARVGEAERRLRTTAQTVTRIAFDLGFLSSQYFATVIKRYTGRRPGQLRGASRSPRTTWFGAARMGAEGGTVTRLAKGRRGDTSRPAAA